MTPAPAVGIQHRGADCFSHLDRAPRSSGRDELQLQVRPDTTPQGLLPAYRAQQVGYMFTRNEVDLLVSCGR